MTALIFDTETTGLNDPVIVEAAWIEIERPSRPEQIRFFLERYNPGKPIELGALAKHHMLDEELAHCDVDSETVAMADR